MIIQQQKAPKINRPNLLNLKHIVKKQRYHLKQQVKNKIDSSHHSIKTLIIKHDSNNFNDSHRLRIQTSFRQRFQQRAYSNSSNFSNDKNLSNKLKYLKDSEHSLKQQSIKKINPDTSINNNINTNKTKIRKYGQQICRYTSALSLIEQIQESRHHKSNIDIDISTTHVPNRYPQILPKQSLKSSYPSHPSHRSRSQSSNIPLPLSLSHSLTKQQRIALYKQTRIHNHTKLYKQHTRYKNQKLNIISQQHLNIIKTIPSYLIDQNKFQNDINNLLSIFTQLPYNQICVSRHASQNYHTFIGLLLFFIGYEIYMKFTQDYQHEYQNYQLILSNYNQIYYAMRLKASLIILQCYLTIIDLAIQGKNYIHAQKYSQKCLMASIYYKQKYYQQRCIQKLSMCEYYKGNICQATYLHDNNGQVTQDSLRQIKESYNEQEQIEILFHHLYECPRLEIEELLEDYQEKIENYKALVVFKSPRIGPEDSMKYKTDQIKVDIRRMERLKEFKKQAGVIRKEVKKHQSLFTVRRGDKNTDQFKLVKRNMTINQDNQSSQILRAHQSLNRVKKINLKPLKLKLATQFVEFLNRIKTKFR